MLPVREKVVQGGGIGKSGVFAGGSIVILLFSIGAKCRSVEGYQSSSTGLSPIHIFHRRMGALHRFMFSCDQANHLRPIPFGPIVTVPCPPDQRILMDKGAVMPEHQIASRHKLLPAVGQCGMTGGLFRLPCAEKGQHRLGSRAVYPIQQLLMKSLARLETFQGPLGLSLVVCAQQIACVVTKKIGNDPHGAFHRRRQPHDLRGQNGLFPFLLLCLQGNHLFQRSLWADAQSIGNFGLSPAKGGDLTAVFQRAVIFRQRLQDHRRTSSLSQGGTSSTPSRRIPRKKRGVIFSGSV